MTIRRAWRQDQIQRLRRSSNHELRCSVVSDNRLMYRAAHRLIQGTRSELSINRKVLAFVVPRLRRPAR